MRGNGKILRTLHTREPYELEPRFQHRQHSTLVMETLLVTKVTSQSVNRNDCISDVTPLAEATEV